MRPYFYASALLAALAALALTFWRLSEGSNERAFLQSSSSPERIVSAVPSITQVLFALGLGKRVVGVTSFCKLPEGEGERPRIGGYFDPDYEVILSLRPDLVLTMPQQVELRKKLRELGLRAESIDQNDLAGIIGSILKIGKICGVEKRARELVSQISERIRRVCRSVRPFPRPRVLLCVERTVQTGRLEEVYAAGGSGFYDELITKAGGVNVLSGVSSPYPRISKEDILKLNPEVIVDLLPNLKEKGLSPEEAEKQWLELKAISAVREGRIYVITDSYAVIPGPRIIDFLEKLALLFHPQLKKKNGKLQLSK